MKKLLVSVLVSALLIACTDSGKKSEGAEKQPNPVAHIFKPTYTDNFKIGDPKNVLLAEQFHKLLFEKDFKQAGELIADTAQLNNDDGSVLKGKAAIVDFMEKNFAGITIKNFQIAAILPVVGENGHQWVDIWDEADLVTPDGKTQKYQWVDAFRFENGKIVHFIGFAKAVKG